MSSFITVRPEAPEPMTAIFFFGTGAYLSSWLVADYNWAWFSTLLVVIPVCFLLGMAFGIPALRIKGLYLALVTLGLAAIFPSIVQLKVLEEQTAGAAGKHAESGDAD